MFHTCHGLDPPKNQEDHICELERSLLVPSPFSHQYQEWHCLWRSQDMYMPVVNVKIHLAVKWKRIVNSLTAHAPFLIKMAPDFGMGSVGGVANSIPVFISMLFVFSSVILVYQ